MKATYLIWCDVRYMSSLSIMKELDRGRGITTGTKWIVLFFGFLKTVQHSYSPLFCYAHWSDNCNPCHCLLWHYQWTELETNRWMQFLKPFLVFYLVWTLTLLFCIFKMELSSLFVTSTCAVITEEEFRLHFLLFFHMLFYINEVPNKVPNSSSRTVNLKLSHCLCAEIVSEYSFILKF